MSRKEWVDPEVGEGERSGKVLRRADGIIDREGASVAQKSAGRKRLLCLEGRTWVLGSSSRASSSTGPARRSVEGE